MRGGAAVRCIALTLALFMPALSIAAAGSSEITRCHALSDQVAASCPQACKQRHCAARCIPPFADTGRCSLCAERCDGICTAMDEARSARCDADSTLSAPAN